MEGGRRGREKGERGGGGGGGGGDVRGTLGVGSVIKSSSIWQQFICHNNISARTDHPRSWLPAGQSVEYTYVM